MKRILVSVAHISIISTVLWSTICINAEEMVHIFMCNQKRCGLFIVPLRILSNIRQLTSVMNPAGMNLPELRNLSPITAVRVPEVPKESQIFFGF